MALRSLLTGIEKVSAGDVVGAEMAQDIRDLVLECFASIDAAMAETARVSVDSIPQADASRDPYRSHRGKRCPD